MQIIQTQNQIDKEIVLKLHQLVVAGACVALGTTAMAQSAAPGAMQKETARTYALFPASKLLGLDVKNDSSKDVGDIGDLLLDPQSGEIRYGVLDVGGVLGVGEDHRIVPWSFIQIVPDEKDADKAHARTTLTADQVKAAPKCKVHDPLGADLDKRIEASFGKNEGWTYAGKGEPSFVWASDVKGVLVNDPANKEIGKIKDLVLAPANGCVAYAVVDTVKDAGGKVVALPWGRVGLSYDHDRKLTGSTPVDQARFASAPEYDSKDWKRMSSTPWVTEISTYYACDPFWKTTRFASARTPPAPQKP
jgi:sporulation protein YlmC with PRC-barrel domain